MEGYVLILATSATCGHCVTSKNKHYEDFIKRASAILNLDIIHVEYIDSNYTYKFIKVGKGSQQQFIHPKFISYIRWFPEFFLVSKSTWYDPSSNLEGFVYNGNFTPDSTEIDADLSKRTANTADKLMEWINGKISQSPAVKSTSNYNIISNRGHGF